MKSRTHYLLALALLAGCAPSGTKDNTASQPGQPAGNAAPVYDATTAPVVMPQAVYGSSPMASPPLGNPTTPVAAPPAASPQ